VSHPSRPSPPSPRASRRPSFAPILLAALAATPGPAQISFFENFTGTSADGWYFGGSGYTPNLTAATLDAARPFDPADPNSGGWLRLTDNGPNRSTFALLDTRLFSVNTRLEITFDFTFWNGSGADGATLFLIDGDLGPSTFSPGSYGGSLGYAPRGGGPGMSGGYLGFALDTFGNYSNAAEGRNGGLGPGATRYPNRVAVRGPESAAYPFIAASAPLPQPLAFPAATTRPDQTGTTARSLQISLDANNQLEVRLRTGASSPYTSILTADLSAYERPDTLKLGFTGATGSLNQIHEVRNLSVLSTPWATHDGAYEWDRGAGTPAWGTLAGAEPNANWYHPAPATDDRSPARDSDILLGDRPGLTAGPQTIQLDQDIEVRNLTFDSHLDYTLGTLGAGRTLTLGDPTRPGLPSIHVNDYHGAHARHKINADLALVERLALRNFSYSTLCLNGTFATAGHPLTITGHGSVNLNGDLTGSGDLHQNGPGITTLNNNNADASPWTGAAHVRDGLLVVTTDGALGSTSAGTTVHAGGTLALRGGVDYTHAEALTLHGLGVTRGPGQLAGALHNDGGDNRYAGPLTLGSTTAIGSRAGTLTLAGTLAQDAPTDRHLIKLGAGTLALTGANTLYDNQLILREGALRLGSTAAYSTALNYRLDGGILELGADLNGPAPADLEIKLGTGNNALRWTADGGFSAHGADRSLRLNYNTDPVTWGAGPFVADDHALLFGSATSTHTFTLANAIALGASLREVRVTDGLDNTTGAVDGALSGTLSGTGGLHKTGDGTLELTANNTYTGQTRLSAGALRVTAANRIDGSPLVLDGGVLEIAGDLDLANPGDFTRALGSAPDEIRWTGDGGFAATHAPRTVRLGNGTNPLAWGLSPGFLDADSRLILGATSANQTLTLANDLALGATGTRTLHTIRGTTPPATLATGALTGLVSGTATLALTGDGRLDLTAANPHAGALTLSGAELRLTGPAGSLANTTSIDIRHGGTLTLHNATAGNSNRLGDTTPLTLAGGTLALHGRNASSADFTETIGTLTLATGANTLEVVNYRSNAFTQLNVASLQRAPTATIDFAHPGSIGDTGTYTSSGDDPRLRFATAPLLDDGILAYATVNGTDFATVTGARYLIPRTSYDTGSQTGWTSTADNAAPTSDQTLGASRTINSLKLANARDLDLAGHTLTLQSGGLLTTGSTTGVTLGNGTLTTGSHTELIVHAYNTSAAGTDLSATLAGTGRLTKTGPGTLTLSGTTANTLTGATTVNQGTLVLAKTDGLHAIAGDGDTTTPDLIIGDGRGTDTVRLAANQQIADDATVQLRGGPLGQHTHLARLALSGATTPHGTARLETFHTLQVTGQSILDFDGGGACAPTLLHLDYLDIAADALLTITHWIQFTDFLLVEKATLDPSQLARVVFDGYSGAARWQTYDDVYFQITPVPEPATYGLLALGGLTGFLALRRRPRPRRPSAS
jgi:autotransporter-associated beta strand protein